jgi:hypothetical protein
MTELPGEQYTPSNGTEGAQFLSDWCGTCARDKSFREGEPLDECDDNETCPIIAASFRGEAVEWRVDGSEVFCVSFVQKGDRIPPPRDELTIDMFDAPKGGTECAEGAV